MNPFALTAEERAGAMMAPARAPDVGAFMDNIDALRAMLGPSVAQRMVENTEDQKAWLAAGNRGPRPLTEDRVWLADDVAGALLGPIGMAGVIKAYHGSPHRFDRFDMSKIGTGEGAQAYGHGLYFAEGEDTARTYQKALANIAHPDRGPEWVAKQWLSENGGDVATAEAALRESITSWKSNPIANNDPQLREMIANMESAIPLLGRVTPEPGALYTTRLNVEPDDLLDWDKPLSEQSAKVRAALESALPTPRAEVTVKGNVIYENGLEIGSIREYRRSGFDPPRYSISAGARTPDREFLSKDDAIAFLKEWGNAQTGEDIYRLLNTQFGFDPAKASAALREAGIPGIKYLDQGSRAFKARTTYKGKPYSDDVAFATREQAERWAEQKRAEGFGAEVFQDGTRNFVIFDDSLISIKSVD